MAKQAKQIERKITITYRWWRDDHKTIMPDHVLALEEEGTAHIKEQMNEGFTSGELLASIAKDCRHPENHLIAYKGHWHVETEKTEHAGIKCPKCGKVVWDVATADQHLNKCWECGLRFFPDCD
jgi:predicted RNA-binding Zn-ribbon protein involved in translation (DUF1610 family)